MFPNIVEAGCAKVSSLIPRTFQASIFIAAIGFSLGSGVGNASEGGVGRQLLWAMLGGVALVSITNGVFRGEFQKFSWGGPILVSFVTFSIASVVWSYTPLATAKRSALLVIVLLISAAAFGKSDNRHGDFDKVLGVPLLALLLASILITVLSPGYAFTDLGWRGITSHKNEMGQVMAVAVILMLFGAWNLKHLRFIRLSILAVLFGGLILSKSSTSLLGLVAAISITVLVTLPRTLERRDALKVFLLGSILIVSIMLYVAYTADMLPDIDKVYSWLLAKMGKSANFTGRTAIWQLVMSESRYHNPLIGGGYGGFWVGRESVSGYIIVGDNLYPGQAHNGYLDIFNELGIIGVSLLVLILLVATHKLWTIYMLNHRETPIHISIAVMMVCINLGETTFFRTTQFTSIVFIASLVRVSALVKEGKKSKPINVAMQIEKRT